MLRPFHLFTSLPCDGSMLKSSSRFFVGVAVFKGFSIPFYFPLFFLPLFLSPPFSGCALTALWMSFPLNLGLCSCAFWEPESSLSNDVFSSRETFFKRELIVQSQLARSFTTHLYYLLAVCAGARGRLPACKVSECLPFSVVLMQTLRLTLSDPVYF